MKADLCVLLLAVALVYGAEEKKNEKRGVLGLGYGLAAPAPIVSHGYYGQGLGLYGGLGHGVGFGHGIGYGHGLGYGHGIGLGHSVGFDHGLGLYGHGYAAAPVISHAAPIAYSSYSAPVLGHGYLGHGWH